MSELTLAQKLLKRVHTRRRRPRVRDGSVDVLNGGAFNLLKVREDLGRDPILRIADRFLAHREIIQLQTEGCRDFLQRADGAGALPRFNLAEEALADVGRRRAGVRDVPLPSIVAQELLSFMRAESLTAVDAFLFRTSGGKPMGNSNFHRALWRPLLKTAGLEDGGKRYHFHASRHFSASWLIENGWTLPEVQKVMGHASFDITMSTYVHALKDDSHRIENAERAAQILKPSSVSVAHTVRYIENTEQNQS